MDPVLNSDHWNPIYITFDPIEHENRKELRYEEWKNNFLSAVQQEDGVDKLEECFHALSSLDRRFNSEDSNDQTADETAQNRGKFILETLNNGNAKMVRKFLNLPDQTPASAVLLKDEGYFTPYFLNNVQAVRCMVRHNCKLGKPEKYRKEEGLDQAFTRISHYMALLDPVYIAACAMENPNSVSDPILHAFELRWELKRAAKTEYEFKNEYDALATVCGQFGVALLGECESIEPDVRCMLDSANGNENDQPLDILHLAIMNHDKKFVCHPYTQMLLNWEILEHVPYLKTNRTLTVFFVALLMVLLVPLLPIIIVFDLCYPQHPFTKLASSPFMKYLTNLTSHVFFLLLLIDSARRPLKAFLEEKPVDWLIFVWIVGMSVDILTEKIRQTRRIKSILTASWGECMKICIASPWDCVAIAMIFLFAIQHIWFVGAIPLQDDRIHNSQTNGSHPAILVTQNKIKYFQVVIVSYSFTSGAYVLAFIYFLSFMRVTSYLGPLLHALGHMMKDVVKFFICFTQLFLAFIYSFKKLYNQYDQAMKTFHFKHFHNNTGHSSHFITLDEDIQLVFWALFGSFDTNAFHTSHQYLAIEKTGLVLFGLFQVVIVLVGLNILIAMLNTSYSKVAEDLDSAWKFTRSLIWMQWIIKREVVPPPFNIISLLVKFAYRVCLKKNVLQGSNAKRVKITKEKRCDVLQTLIKKYLSERTRKYKAAARTPAK